MPAASWPRCCSACSPRATIAAASGWLKMPNTPQCSRSRSSIEVEAGLVRRVRPAMSEASPITALEPGRRRRRRNVLVDQGVELLLVASPLRRSIRSSSGPPAPGWRGGLIAGRLGVRGGRIVRRRRRKLVRRRARARLDPAVDGRCRVFRQQGDDPIGRLGQDRPRPGVFDPFRLLLLRNQPIEDSEGDHGEQEPPRHAEHEAERPIQARRSCCRESRPTDER